MLQVGDMLAAIGEIIERFENENHTEIECWVGHEYTAMTRRGKTRETTIKYKWNGEEFEYAGEWRK